MPEIADDEASVQEDITSLVRLLLQVRGPKRKQDLASAIGVSPDTLSHSLSATGRRRPWTTHEVVRIAAYYRISSDALLGMSPARENLIAELRAEAAAAIEDDV